MSLKLKFDDYCKWRNRECIKDSPKLLKKIRNEWKELTLNATLVWEEVRNAYIYNACYSKKQVIEMGSPPPIKDLCWDNIGFNHWLLYTPSSDISFTIRDGARWNPSCHDDEVTLGQVMGYFEPGCPGTRKTFVLEFRCRTPTDDVVLWSERVRVIPDGLQKKLERLEWALHKEGAVSVTITSNPGWN